MTGREWVEVFGAAAVILGSGITSWFTGQAASRASAATSAVGLATVDATREDNLIGRLENRLAAVEKEASVANDRVEEQRRVIYRLQDRVVALERADREHQALVRDLRRFIRLLLDTWPMPGQPVLPPPKPPVGLLDERGPDDS